jgi:peptide/nickel transport system ATP-binding protein
MPHHFSGGMRQRIAIAIALAGRPKLLLADEPTTALDQETQAQILALLKNVDITTIFITHDLSLVEDIADRVAIMQAGEIVESGQVKEIFENPQHPYTKKLLGYLDYGKGRGHSHKHEETVRGKHLVEIENIKKYFPLGRKKVHKALDGFSMNIHRGEILGIVGPSGCGKSTLARCIMGMEKLTGGEIRFYNNAAGTTDMGAGDTAFACSLQHPFRNSSNWKQMIFQDSDSAFNPRMTIGEIIAEPMKIAQKQQNTKGLFERKAVGSQPFEESTCRFCNAWHEKMSMRDRVIDLMKQVELDPELIDRHPYEVSGGQRQRAAIARAISVDPELIIADEPISSLDISTQAQIVHLFRKLQEERNLTILFIAHDLPMVNHISDRIIEMK